MPLAHLRVVDLTRSVAGSYAAALLAALGAQVVRATPPEAALPAEIRALPSPARAALESWLHRAKSRADGWPGTADALRAPGTSFGDGNAILEDWTPGEREMLGWGGWWDALPSRPVDVSVTDDGLDPACQGEALDEARRLAETGHALHGPDARLPARPPWIASALAGLYAACGALMALRRPGGTRTVSRVEVSVLEALASLRQTAIERWHAGGSIPEPPSVVHACRDGYVAAPLGPVTPPELLAALTQDAAYADNPALADLTTRAVRQGRWLARQSRDDAVARAQMLQLPFGRVRDLREVLIDAHLAARGVWRGTGTEGSAPGRLPGMPFQVHRASGASSPNQDRSPPLGSARDPGGEVATLPLSGLRVLELSAAWAGPMVGRLLAAYGAEVLRIEPPGAASEPLERAAQHRGKRSLVLDLSREPDRVLLRRLAGRADAVIENFRPGVIEGWGCGFDTLSSEHPALILLSLSGFGRGGPRSGWRALGATVEAETGWASLLADAEGTPRLFAEPLSDPAAALHGLLALLAALHERDRTGRGAHIDLSQAECALHLIGDRAALAFAGHDPRLGGAVGDPLGARDLASLCAWPYLRARGAFEAVPAPNGQAHTHPRPPIRLDGMTSGSAPASAPDADRARVLGAWLGIEGAD